LRDRRDHEQARTRRCMRLRGHTHRVTPAADLVDRCVGRDPTDASRRQQRCDASEHRGQSQDVHERRGRITDTEPPEQPHTDRERRNLYDGSRQKPFEEPPTRRESRWKTSTYCGKPGIRHRRGPKEDRTRANRSMVGVRTCEHGSSRARITIG